MQRFLCISLQAVIIPAVLTITAAGGCGRTDLEFYAGGRDGSLGAGGGDAGRDAGMDATGGRGAGGVVGSGGRPATTGGTSGTGGRIGSGGVTATGGRVGTGGVTATGGRIGSGGVTATGGRVGTGGATDGGVRDGGPDRPPVDAAGPDLPPPTPGMLQCGTQLCNTATQSCCVSIAVGSVGAMCVPIGSMCGGAALDCDEPADCAAGVCCFGLQVGGGGVGLGSRCVARASCAGVGRFVVCRTNADCRAGAPICCNSLGVPVCQATCSGS